MTPKNPKDYLGWCYKFLSKETLPLKQDFEKLSLDLAIYIADEVNKANDEIIIELGKLKGSL